MQETWDHSREAEVVHWLERVSGDVRGSRALGEWLRDGELLCCVANAILPGIVPRVHRSDKKFKQRDNIMNFIHACQRLGVDEVDLFDPDDLLEERDLRAVKICIFLLGTVVRTTVPAFEGPWLDASAAAGSPRHRDHLPALLHSGAAMRHAKP